MSDWDVGQCNEYYNDLKNNPDRIQSWADCRITWDYYYGKCQAVGAGTWDNWKTRVCGHLGQEPEGDGFDLGDIWESIKEKVIDTIYSIFGGIIESLREIVQSIGDWIKQVVDNIVNVFKRWGEVITNIIDSVREWFHGVLQAIKRLYEQVRDWIVDIYERVRDWITQTIENVGQWISDLYERVKEAVISAYELVKNAFVTAINWLGKSLSLLWESIKSGFGSFVTWLSEGLKTIVSSVKGWIANVANSLASAFKTVGRWFEDAFEKIGGVLKAIGDALSDLVKIIAEGISLAWRYVQNELINDLVSVGGPAQKALEHALTNAVLTTMKIGENVAKNVLASGNIPEASPGWFGSPEDLGG